MFGAQGRLPPIFIKGKMIGANASGSITDNSVVYRGRPYSFENALEQEAIDFNTERKKVSWQNGLRVVAIYCTTSQQPES